MEIPDNALHFQDDGANIWVFGTVNPAKESYPRKETSSPQGNVIPAQAGISALLLRFVARSFPV